MCFFACSSSFVLLLFLTMFFWSFGLSVSPSVCVIFILCLHLFVLFSFCFCVIFILCLHLSVLFSFCVSFSLCYFHSVSICLCYFHSHIYSSLSLKKRQISSSVFLNLKPQRPFTLVSAHASISMINDLCNRLYCFYSVCF